jgi:hypothetical protein
MVKPLNLMLHCGAQSVSREEVLGCDTPDPTETHFPIPHGMLIRMMEERLPALGLSVVNEAHGLYNQGDRYFGMFQLAAEDGGKIIGNDGTMIEAEQDYNLVWGVRNSHDKKFPAGYCCGSGVFVCDNLCFSAEIVFNRRHTKNIEKDLPGLVSTTMGRLVQARVDQAQRLDAYKATDIADNDAAELILNSLDAGAMNKTRIPKVWDQWKKPEHDEFDKKNVWRLFNAFTEVYKDTSLVELPKRSTRLHGLLDGACGLETIGALKNDLETMADDVTAHVAG